jgi:phosphohistidine phosphatase
MKLYLVRHGEALPKHADPKRALSDRGREEVTAVAQFLGRAGVRVAEVQHSGKERAKQTAEILARAIADGRVSQRSDIAPLDDVAPLVAEAGELSDDLMIVGHLPFMANAVSELVGGRAEPPVVAFQAAGCACLVRHEGAWMLTWMVVPALLDGGALPTSRYP